MRRIIVPLKMDELGLKENTISMALFCESDNFGMGTLRYANWSGNEVVLQFDYDGVLSDRFFCESIGFDAAKVAARCIEREQSGEFIDWIADGLNLVQKEMK